MTDHESATDPTEPTQPQDFATLLTSYREKFLEPVTLPSDDKIKPAKDSKRDRTLTVLLDMLLGDPEHAGTSFSLTVTTSSGMVTGTCITAQDWLGGSVAAFAEQAPSQAAAFQVITEGRMEVFAAVEARRQETEKALVGRSYLHFRDVTLVTGGQNVAMLWWRVPIHEVTGWNLGSVTF